MERKRERRKHTKLESRGHAFPQFQARQDPRRSNSRPRVPALDTRPPTHTPPPPPSSAAGAPTPPAAAYLRSHTAAGSAQTGCVTTPAEKRRCTRGPRRQPRVPSSPAAGKSGRRCWEQLSMSLGAQLRPLLPAWGRPLFLRAPRGPQARRRAY